MHMLLEVLQEAGRDFANTTASTQPIAKAQGSSGTAPFYLEFDNGPFLDLPHIKSYYFRWHLAIIILLLK